MAKMAKRSILHYFVLSQISFD